MNLFNLDTKTIKVSDKLSFTIFFCFLLGMLLFPNKRIGSQVYLEIIGLEAALSGLIA